jgi:hypothetical protein
MSLIENSDSQIDPANTSDINNSMPMPDDDIVFNNSILDDSGLEIDSIVSNVLSINGSFTKITEPNTTNLDTSNIFDDIPTQQNNSTTNTSNNDISLEGGLQLNENGDVDYWSIDLDIDYASANSATRLDSLSGEDSSSFFRSDILLEPAEPEEPEQSDFLLRSDNINNNQIQYNQYYPPVQYKDPPLWMVLFIIFTSFIMLITALTVFDILVCSACPKNKICHTPIFISLLKQLGFVI